MRSAIRLFSLDLPNMVLSVLQVLVVLHCVYSEVVCNNFVSFLLLNENICSWIRCSYILPLQFFIKVFFVQEILIFMQLF